ncbi:hypothetical protein [Bacillus sp. ISTL8]|uniref:hypothetical protein n=1 Tax=Bacillus sp. ISTL8 TaxID=2596896 RepID=UPI0014569EDF|nr:hypothetical protein [Bacillus sp. ISTL8]
MKEMIKEWGTSEIVDFLNSYNRVLEVHKEVSEPWKAWYAVAKQELDNRSPLMAMLYK